MENIRIKKSDGINFVIIVIGFLVMSCTNTKQQGFYESGKEIRLLNTTAELIIDKANWHVKVLDKAGVLHYEELRAPSFQVNEEWITLSKVEEVDTDERQNLIIRVLLSNNKKANLRIERAGDSGFHIEIMAENISAIKGISRLGDKEQIYGFGETWNGHIAQRGQTIQIWDKGGTPDECAYMPYYVSTQNYGFYLNYGGLVNFDIGQKNTEELTYEMEANTLDYTVFIGESVASCVQKSASLTGMPSKPPRWAFEPWFWLMSDPNEPEGELDGLRGEHFIEMIEKLEQLNIPIGVTWLEPPWQTARTTFIPNKEFCPDLKGLIDDIAGHGVKTLAWTVPYTSPEASNWEEAVTNGYLVKKPGGETDNRDIKITESGELDGTFYNKIDYYNPEAVKWWQQQIEKSLELGLKGFKLDAGQALPEDGLLFDGRLGKDYHNSIALEYNKTFHQALTNKLGDDFLMIPRAAWIGSGAQTNFKWPGDLDGSFADNGLSSSVYSSLSLAMSGFSFVSTDIGGFEGRPTPEQVWIRWAQFGAMLPGMQTLNMPWWYSQKAMEHFRYLTWLHTDLIPYWETLGKLSGKTCIPVCRPLIWDYQDDPETWSVEDEYTIGEYILVAPIITEESEREVYFPEGTWFDFRNNNEVYEGKQKILWKQDGDDGLYQFPLYVKEGATIPLEVKNDFSGFGSKYSEGFITLAMWPEQDAENRFVLNDREGPVEIQTAWQQNTLQVKWGKSEKNYLFRIHIKEGLVPNEVNTGKQFDTELSFEQSKTSGWYFNPETQKLWIKKVADDKSGLLDIRLNMIQQ